jgi:hypothetical protein
VWHGSAQHPTASNEFRVRAYWWDPLDGSYYASLDWVTVSVSPGGDPEDMPGEVGDFELAAVNPVTASSVTLVWDDVAGESAYDLSYVTASDTRTPYSIRWWDTSPEDANNRRLEADVTQHTFSGLTAGTTYHFVLQALGGGPDDSYRTESHVVSATTLEWPLPAPSDVGARAAPDLSGIQLRWRDNSTTESGFLIERSADGELFEPLAQVGANVTSYTDDDPDLVLDATYYYHVKSFNEAGTSDPSYYDFAVIVSPRVSITADIPACSEFKGDWGQYKVSRELGSLARRFATTVFIFPVALDPPAAIADDYQALENPLTIPAGQTHTFRVLRPVADEIVELDEPLSLRVESEAVLTVSDELKYKAGSPFTATVTIQERDLIDIDSDNNDAFGNPARTKLRGLDREPGWQARQGDCGQRR